MPRPNRARALVLSLLGASALVAVPLTQIAQGAPSASNTLEHSVHMNTDNQREKYDRGILKKSACIDGFAERHARKMAAEQKMYHQDLGPILKACKLNTVGENVAYGYSTGNSVVSAWMNSPGHRANILNKSFRLDGVGAYKGKDGRWYIAQVLGRSA